MPLFGSRSGKIFSLLVDIVIKNKLNMWFSVVTLIDNEYVSSQWSKCCGPQYFDHCDDAYPLSIRVQTTLNHIRFVNSLEMRVEHKSHQ